jgi:hypothetical protein
MKKIGFLSFGRWTPSPPFPGCAGADAIEACRQAWKKAGHEREPRVS